MDYQTALDHIERCKYECYVCPYKCTIGPGDELTSMLGKDLEDHLKSCPKVLYKCEICGILRPRVGEHDCFEELMKSIKEAGKKCDETEKLLGMDYDRLKPLCARKHKMVRQRGNLMVMNGSEEAFC